MLALRYGAPRACSRVMAFAQVSFESLSYAADVHSLRDVPLGSELLLEFDENVVDVRVENGSPQDLSIRADGGCSVTVQEELVNNNNSTSSDRARYIVKLNDTKEGHSRGRPHVWAGIPPRYFGLRVQTGGNVELVGGIKEARDIHIRTHGGRILSKSGLSTETLALFSGGGSIQATDVTAAEADINARRAEHGLIETGNGSGEYSEDVQIRKVSCLRLSVQGRDVRIDSLNSRSAHVSGATVSVGNTNTLDGEALFHLRGDKNTHPSAYLGGVDGKIVLDDGGNDAAVEVQLNHNARRVEFRTSAKTEVCCYKTPELRIIEETGGNRDCARHTRGDTGHEVGLQPECRMVTVNARGSRKPKIENRSWRASVEQRLPK